MPFFNKILKLANGAKQKFTSSDKPNNVKDESHQHQDPIVRKDILMSSYEDSFEIIEMPEWTTGIKGERGFSPHLSQDEEGQQIDITLPKNREDTEFPLFRKAAGDLRSQVFTSPYLLRPDCIRCHGKGKGKAYSRSDVLCRKGRCEGKGEMMCQE